MALLDIFKKKKTPKIEKIKKAPEPKEIKPEISRPKIKKSEAIYRNILYPHITEKATNLTKEDKYIFNVRKESNKNEIKKAIESMYGVNVIGVKTINIPPKKVRLGKNTGWKKGYKKAIVEIEKGQKIEVLPR